MVVLKHGIYYQEKNCTFNCERCKGVFQVHENELEPNRVVWCPECKEVCYVPVIKPETTRRNHV